MFSNRFLKVVEIHYLLSRISWATPLKFNSSTRQITLPRFARLRCYFMVIVLLALSFYLILQVFRIYRLKNYNSDNFYFLYGLTIVCLISNCFQLIFSLLPKELAFIIREILEFLVEIKEQFRPLFDPNKDRMTFLFDYTLIFIQLMCLNGGIVTTFHFIAFPNAPMYPINDLPYDWGKLFWVRVVQFFVWGLINLAGWSYVATTLISAGTYAMYIIPLVVNEMSFAKRGSKKKPMYKTRGSLRQPEVLKCYYRRVEILHLYLLKLFGLILVPIQTLIYQLVLFCNFMLLTKFDSLSKPTTIMLIIWSGFGTFGWTLTLHIGGQMHVRSSQTLSSWGRHDWGTPRDNKMMSKFRKSCLPLKLGYERTFIIRRLTVLKFLRGVIKGTFRTLLTTKNK
ncbi:unnamed protein product [Orchesella dallaii]|uniref:Odorant receptor n=1 Tax=Orchesella dallaii TaxID=48710 RepID=A0ABP1Q3H4_9HEXA